MKKQYQKQPFRIQISRCGSFDALAADGLIKPRTKKAVESSYDPKVRETVEAYAYSYLGRKDWTWEIPEKFKNEQTDVRG